MKTRENFSPQRRTYVLHTENVFYTFIRGAKRREVGNFVDLAREGLKNLVSQRNLRRTFAQFPEEEPSNDTF